MKALHCSSCRAGCSSGVSLLSVPRQGWLLSGLGQQGLKHTCQLETTRYGPYGAVDGDINLLNVWAAPDRGTVFSCRECQGLSGDP